ncbi:hypothetical protein ACFSHQ_12170 [Gemmobacter lanyuensis]
MARDGDPRARALCAALATANGVAARVEIGGIIDHADLALCALAPTVVICDIEGAEVELLDPVGAPALLAADLLVEVHEGCVPVRLRCCRSALREAITFCGSIAVWTIRSWGMV